MIEKSDINKYNDAILNYHKRKLAFVAEGVYNINDIIQKLIAFQIAIPSLALGTGGTRF